MLKFVGGPPIEKPTVAPARPPRIADAAMEPPRVPRRCIDPPPLPKRASIAEAVPPRPPKPKGKSKAKSGDVSDYANHPVDEYSVSKKSSVASRVEQYNKIQQSRVAEVAFNLYDFLATKQDAIVRASKRKLKTRSTKTDVASAPDTDDRLLQIDCAQLAQIHRPPPITEESPSRSEEHCIASSLLDLPTPPGIDSLPADPPDEVYSEISEPIYEPPKAVFRSHSSRRTTEHYPPPLPCRNSYPLTGPIHVRVDLPLEPLPSFAHQPKDDPPKSLPLPQRSSGTVTSLKALTNSCTTSRTIQAKFIASSIRRIVTGRQHRRIALPTFTDTMAPNGIPAPPMLTNPNPQMAAEKKEEGLFKGSLKVKKWKIILLGGIMIVLFVWAVIYFPVIHLTDTPRSLPEVSVSKNRT